MINELLNEIKEAENKAKAMEIESLEYAKKMSLDADEKAAEMKNKARADAKIERAMVIASAEDEAEKNFDRILEIGKQEAEKLMERTDITAATQKITSLFIKKWAQR